MSTKQIQKPISDIYTYDNQIKGIFRKIERDLPENTIGLINKYDREMINTESGTSFINNFNQFYYSFSPHIADYERENPLFKKAGKFAITPMISNISILNYVDMDSEAEVLGYGISLIILNIGMYVGIPVVEMVGIRKRF